MLISPIGQLRAKGIDFGTIVTTADEPASWQVSPVSGGDGPLVWLTYCGAAATVKMCIKEFADEYPEPLNHNETAAATASVANIAAILTPAAELEAAKAKALDEKQRMRRKLAEFRLKNSLKIGIATQVRKDLPYIQNGRCLDRLQPRFWPLRV